MVFVRGTFYRAKKDSTVYSKRRCSLGVVFTLDARRDVVNELSMLIYAAYRRESRALAINPEENAAEYFHLESPCNIDCSILATPVREQPVLFVVKKRRDDNR